MYQHGMVTVYRETETAIWVSHSELLQKQNISDMTWTRSLRLESFFHVMTGEMKRVCDLKT